MFGFNAQWHLAVGSSGGGQTGGISCQNVARPMKTLCRSEEEETRSSSLLPSSSPVRPALSFFPSFYFRSHSFRRTSLSLSFFYRGVDALATLIGNNKRELDAIPKGNFSSSRLTTPIPSPLDGLEDPWIRFHTTGALLLYIIATVYVIEATTTTTMMGARISRK